MLRTTNTLMDMPTSDFVRAGSLAELKAKGRLVVHGRHSPILVIYHGGRVFALDNRCPHMGFPLDRGSVEDGILTCHWHHARFDLASGCTFDLWADDVPTCPVELCDGEVWIKPSFGHGDPSRHWRHRLDDGLAHNLGLVIAKAIRGQLMAGVPSREILRQAALFVVRNRDGWGVGATILTALGNMLPVLPEEQSYLALFHGARRVAADCDGEAPRRERAPLASGPDLATLQRWRGTGAPCAIAKPPNALCSPPSPTAPRRPRLRACYSRQRRTASSPTADTRSTSSTRLASAST
jgi:nitrite reductase/ring-hydroxylating ferredoxin subunit